MLKTAHDRAICARYSTRGARGLVRCGECPLRINTCRIDNACRANSHWDSEAKQWELDGDSADELFENGWKKMLKYTDITGREVDKVATAIKRLKLFEPPEGYWACVFGWERQLLY